MSEELIEYAEHLIEEEENKTRGCNVEKILNKRIQNGITEYYVKWVGFSANDNSWEAISNLNCPDSIETFEKELLENKKEESTSANLKTESSGLWKYTPEQIIGATDKSGSLHFLIKWKDHDLADLISSKEAHLKCPDLVVSFYKERLASCDI